MREVIGAATTLADSAAKQLQVALPTGQLQVAVEHSRLPMDDLLGFAARANAKRGFLFLSKVLGKHWPVRPYQMSAIHRDLASQIGADLPGPILFIALAETAIGLGQGVFEAYLARNRTSAPAALFLHSSRYRAGSQPGSHPCSHPASHAHEEDLIEFAEAHSHAPRQFLHLPLDAQLHTLLRTARTLVLVDDEASTGNTFVNLCQVLRGYCPDLAHVHLALITDFMGEQTRAALSQRFALPVSIGATLTGQYRFEAGQMQPASEAAQRFEAASASAASSAFGRRGIASALDSENNALAKLSNLLCRQIGSGEMVLVLGTGEFMHPAFLLARALEQAGLNVMVQATTRSPILSWGAVGSRLQFPDNYGEGIANYLYNVTPGQYQHVLICHETDGNAALYQLARTLQGRLFHFKTEDQIEEIPVC